MSISISTPRDASGTGAPTGSTRLTEFASVDQPAACMVAFTTINALFQAIFNTKGDILVVQGVSSTDFLRIEKARDSHRRSFRLRRYDSENNLLIITIPTDVHEQLHLDLNDAFRDELDRLGTGGSLKQDWKLIGSATRRSQHGHPGGDGGEGDSTGAPRSVRPPPKSWPTLVIEAGDSESLVELRKDMEWWFHASGHEVKIVLLAKLDKPSRRLLLEKWIETPAAQDRAGATTTRAVSRALFSGSLLTQRRDQSITITRIDGNPPTQHVTSGSLRLEFELLFLRQPVQNEGDFIITIPRLQEYAQRVWAEVVED